MQAFGAELLKFFNSPHQGGFHRTQFKRIYMFRFTCSVPTNNITPAPQLARYRRTQPVITSRNVGRQLKQDIFALDRHLPQEFSGKAMGLLSWSRRVANWRTHKQTCHSGTLSWSQLVNNVLDGPFFVQPKRSKQAMQQTGHHRNRPTVAQERKPDVIVVCAPNLCLWETFGGILRWEAQDDLPFQRGWNTHFTLGVANRVLPSILVRREPVLISVPPGHSVRRAQS